MDQSTLQKANANRNAREQALRLKSSIDRVDKLSQLEQALHEKNDIRSYHFDRRLAEQLEELQKDQVIEAQTKATEIIDTFIRLLDDEFEQI